MNYQIIGRRRRITSLGAKEESKYTSFFKIRPNCILHLLFISITACSTALHCPVDSQGATRLLHDEAERIQQTVLVGIRNSINVPALYDISITRATFRRHSTSTDCSGYSQSLKLTVEDFLLKEVTSTADMRIFPCCETVSPQIQVYI